MRFLIEADNIKEQVQKYKSILSNHKVLYFEPCSFDNAIIAHFDDFFKADIFFYSREMLIPNPYLTDMKIIEDKNGFLKNLKNNSQELDFLMSSETFNFYVDKFIATSQECFRRIHREEFIYANELLLNMKNTIAVFDDLIHNNPQLGLYKVEKRFSKEIVDFMNSHISPEYGNLGLLTKANSIFLNQLVILSSQGKNNRNVESDKKLLINWFQEFTKPL